MHRKKAASVCCFLAALLLSLALVFSAVLLQLGNASRFSRALQETVPRERYGISTETLQSFADETISYLRGKRDIWQPMVETKDGQLAISPAFTLHMETVREGVTQASRVALCLAAAGCILLFFGWRAGFSTKAYLAGLTVPFLLILCVLLAAWIDFHGFWYWLHENFIPDGIFSAYEPIMLLFPSSLFSSYLFPLLFTLAAGVLFLLAPPLLHKLMIRKRSHL